MDKHFREMDRAIKETDIMDAEYFWKTTTAFFNGELSVDEWNLRLSDNICERLSKHIAEEINNWRE